MRSQGTKPRTLASPAVGCKQAGEHLERGGFPGAVRPKKADEIAFCDLKGDIIDRARLRVFAVKQALERSANSPLLPVSAKGLGQPLKFYGDHSGLPELEVGVKLLIENPPRIESQSPDILPRSALRAGSGQKRALSLREAGFSSATERSWFIFGDLSCKIPPFIRSPTAR